jgi:hypothetical protein
MLVGRILVRPGSDLLGHADEPAVASAAAVGNPCMPVECGVLRAQPVH